MLGKKHRLASSENFKDAPVFSSSEFIIKIKRNNLNVFRFSPVVSKKVDARAVVRNKIKRAIRNFIQENLDRIENGKDVLIIAKMKTGKLEKKELINSLNKIFIKTQLIK